ncbi:uncharacterized protein LOC123581680 [Leopardus geoffroyi]|uniref:uncharacterized protein LOC123581680 n=1 Tax=Leopardus geoffroyi TaxID=46844 RepID=UPI001E261FFC|nr:uncharacterized protein LOC123581680 [Leopardus geoffroyi]
MLWCISHGNRRTWELLPPTADGSGAAWGPGRGLGRIGDPGGCPPALESLRSRSEVSPQALGSASENGTNIKHREEAPCQVAHHLGLLLLAFFIQLEMPTSCVSFRLSGLRVPGTQGCLSGAGRRVSWGGRRGPTAHTAAWTGPGFIPVAGGPVGPAAGRWAFARARRCGRGWDSHSSSSTTPAGDIAPGESRGLSAAEGTGRTCLTPALQSCHPEVQGTPRAQAGRPPRLRDAGAAPPPPPPPPRGAEGSGALTFPPQGDEAIPIPGTFFTINPSQALREWKSPGHKVMGTLTTWGEVNQQNG